MVKRRERPVDESGDLLSPELRWNAERESGLYWDLEEPVPDWWPSDAHGWHRLMARRRLSDARRVYLAGRTSCPADVGVDEFLRAHGFGPQDAGDPKTKHLVY